MKKHRTLKTVLAVASLSAALCQPITVTAAPKANEKTKKQAIALKAPSPTPVAQKTSASQALSTPNLDLSKEPTNISAESLTLLNDKRTFTYQGKVIVTQGDMTLHSDFLDGSYSEKNEIEKIVARSNVEITKGIDLKAHGQRAIYNALDRTIVLTESPSVEQNGSILTADIIRIYVDENRSVAEGNVKVTLKSAEDGLKAPSLAAAGTSTAAPSPTAAPVNTK